LLGRDHSSFLIANVRLWGHAVARLVEALLRNVAGSIPDGVIDIDITSGRTMTLGSTQYPTPRSIYQEYYLGAKDGRFLGLTTLPSSCAECHEIWELQPPGTLDRECFTLYLYHPIVFTPPWW